MNMYGWALVIFLTALVTMLGIAALLGRGLRELDRVRELDKAGREAEPFDLPEALATVYGPFPVDTGPLLILSDKTAANAALEREIRAMGDEAEGKIPPRWRS